MKVLIVNKRDINGGAARAAYRLHKALLKNGIDSKMLVAEKESDDDTVIEIQSGFWGRAWLSLRSYLDKWPLRNYPFYNGELFSQGKYSSHIISMIHRENPDVVHLHWIPRGLMSVRDIAKIKKPLVWSMHDMWAFTGGCHYDNECGRFRSGCGDCPILGSLNQHDLSRRLFEEKRQVYQINPNLTVVGLSKWMSECARTSIVFADKKVVQLPNCLDTSIYKPIDKKIARMMLDIPIDVELIVFGAIKPTVEKRKGFHLLKNALKLMDKENRHLLIFGASKHTYDEDFGFPCHFSGFLHDELSQVIIYSAADVVVVPSLQENLSNVILESLACGTPVVAFNIGGNSDLIEHLWNGYLVEYKNEALLKDGIEWVLNNFIPIMKQYILSHNYSDVLHDASQIRAIDCAYMLARRVQQKFSDKVVASKYVGLYQSVCE